MKAKLGFEEVEWIKNNRDYFFEKGIVAQNYNNINVRENNCIRDFKSGDSESSIDNWKN